MALTYKQQFIKFMVENGVLKFGEFTLKRPHSSKINKPMIRPKTHLGFLITNSST